MRTIASDKKVLIAGLGVTGLSCARFLKRLGRSFMVMDSREHPPALDEFKAAFPHVPCHTGSWDQSILNESDEILLSPGIALSTPEFEAAQKAGLSAGDVLVAVDGLRVKQDRLDKYLAGMPPGKQVSMQVFRRDELMEFILEPEPAPSDTCDLWILQDMGEAVERRRKRWLQYPPEISGQ